MEMHRGTYEVVLDGKRIGSVEDQQRFEAPVDPGRHRLHVRTGRFASRTVAFDAAEDETVVFRCNGRRVWPVLLASLVVPRLALKITRD